jgi:tetratricopeptide (TPR) repeat protein
VGRGKRHRVATGIGLTATALLVATPTLAQQSQSWITCSNRVSATYDQQIVACTAIIDGGSEAPANLARAYCNRGVAYEAKGQVDRAGADYTNAVRLGPEGIWHYLCRGYANHSRGALDQAIADFDQAIAIDPLTAASFAGRGVIYRAKGDVDRAIANYDEAIRLDPKNAIAFFNRGLAMMLKKDYDHSGFQRGGPARSQIYPRLRRPGVSICKSKGL